MTLVMSPDSSYGHYDAPTPADHNMMSPAHKEREPELHIGSPFYTIILFVYLHYIIQHHLWCNTCCHNIMFSFQSLLLLMTICC